MFLWIQCFHFQLEVSVVLELFWKFFCFFSCFCVLVKCPFYGFLKGTGAYSFSNGIHWGHHFFGGCSRPFKERVRYIVT